MTDLMYLLVGPAIVGLFALMYSLTPREWKPLTKEEIFKMWDDNVDKFGTVEDFARTLERAVQDKNS